MNTDDRTKVQTQLDALRSQAAVARQARDATSDESQLFEQQILLRGLDDRIAALTRELS